MQKVENGIPRRNRLDLNTPVELAIRNAMNEVEKAGAHVLLTDAIVLLDQAFNKVADFVEKEKIVKSVDERMADFDAEVSEVYKSGGKL
jgi:hypothetical protein